MDHDRDFHGPGDRSRELIAGALRMALTVERGGLDSIQMPGVGIEPTWDFSRGILSPLRLPFRHPGRSRNMATYRAKPSALHFDPKAGLPHGFYRSDVLLNRPVLVRVLERPILAQRLEVEVPKAGSPSLAAVASSSVS